MDSFDFVRADGGSLMPVVIFIIWFVFSLVGGAQKKKKKQMLEERRRREAAPSTDTSHDSYDKPEDQPEQPDAGNVMGEIKRELETILGTRDNGEEAFSPEKKPQPITTIAPVFTPAAVKTAAVPSFMSYSYDESAMRDREPGAPVVDVDVASIDDARRGVVWSEILAPCKALRGD